MSFNPNKLPDDTEVSLIPSGQVRIGQRLMCARLGLAGLTALDEAGGKPVADTRQTITVLSKQAGLPDPEKTVDSYMRVFAGDDPAKVQLRQLGRECLEERIAGLNAYAPQSKQFRIID